MNLKTHVSNKIQLAIPDADITFVDFSDEHADHHVPGAHIAITVVSKEFVGKPLVEQHQMIYKILDEEIKNQTIHALRIRTRVPGNE